MELLHIKQTNMSVFCCFFFFNIVGNNLWNSLSGNFAQLKERNGTDVSEICLLKTDMMRMQFLA